MGYTEDLKQAFDDNKTMNDVLKGALWIAAIVDKNKELEAQLKQAERETAKRCIELILSSDKYINNTMSSIGKIEKEFLSK